MRAAWRAIAAGGAMVAAVSVGSGRYLRLRRFASTDTLTGLPNRHEFARRAAPIVRRGTARKGSGPDAPGSASCLVVIDLDGFKAVNDSAGHAAGDRVLAAVAEHLRQSVRRHDLVARWGGDEFVMLLVGIGDRDAAVRRVSAMLAGLGDRVHAPGRRLTATFGVALTAEDGDELAELLAVADAAMYAAKPGRVAGPGGLYAVT